MSSIRPRIPHTDDPFIIRLVKDQLFPYAQQSMPELSFKQMDIYKRLSRGKTFVMAEAPGKPIGFVHLIPSNNTLWIDMIAVSPASQGQGAGSWLMEKAESFGRVQAMTSADLFVDKENRRAQQFYLRRGYQVFRFEPGVNCYHMSKSLISAY